jgi:hypothetical protein
LVSAIDGGTEIEGAEENIWNKEEKSEAGGGEILHNEELHDLYSSPSVIRIIKSRRMR